MGLFDLFSKKETVSILGVEFPIFDGKRTWVEGRNNSKYQRKDYYYRMDNEKKDYYVTKLYEYGFTQRNNVRYDKDNAYVIIEESGDRLHIAFHVVKQ